MDPYIIFLLTFIISTLLGFTARTIKFCTLSAIESAFIGSNKNSFRMWILAIAVAIILTQSLIFFMIQI